MAITVTQALVGAAVVGGVGYWALHDVPRRTSKTARAEIFKATSLRLSYAKMKAAMKAIGGRAKFADEPFSWDVTTPEGNVFVYYDDDVAQARIARASSVQWTVQGPAAGVVSVVKAIRGGARSTGRRKTTKTSRKKR